MNKFFNIFGVGIHIGHTFGQKLVKGRLNYDDDCHDEG
jgi:hypothetical protein